MVSKFETSTLKLKALFLQFAHSKGNPIKIVWVVTKTKVAERKVNFSLSEVESIIQLKLSKTTVGVLFLISIVE